MNNKQLQRTLRLLRRTGDRGIVLDPASDEVFVLMDADAYEDLLGMEKPEKGGDNGGIDDYILDDLIGIEESSKEHSEKDHNLPKVREERVNSESGKLSKLNFAEDWATKKPAILSEESLEDVPHEEEEEEKFYLEPVE